jgi:hypothetical protein
MPNFIVHFNKSCEMLGDDDNVTSAHFALYMSLFYHWNRKKFKKNMPINRDEVMRIAGIGSYTTYHGRMKDLHNWGYLVYRPSYHPNIGSRITMHDIDEMLPPAIHDTAPDTTGVPAVVHSKNNLNEVNDLNETKGDAPALPKKMDASGSTRHGRPVDLKEAADYFRAQKSTLREAEKFFNYYQGNGWERKDGTLIKDWEAVARSWISRGEEFKTNGSKRGPTPNHLDTDNDKDFAEPL